MHLVQSTRPRKETVTACLDQFALLLDVPKYRPPWNNPIKIRWQDKFSRWSTCLFFFKQTRLPSQSEKLYLFHLAHRIRQPISKSWIFTINSNKSKWFWRKKPVGKQDKQLVVIGQMWIFTNSRVPNKRPVRLFRTFCYSRRKRQHCLSLLKNNISWLKELSFIQNFRVVTEFEFEQDFKSCF